MAMNQTLRRRLTYGSNATFVTGLVIAVLVLLYVLAQTNRAQWDFSAGGRNTLTPETLAKLRLLDEKGEKVEIYAFTAQRGKEDADFKNRSMKDLLTTMGDHSKLLEWRQVDFDRERLTAERLGVNDYGRVVIKRGEDRVDIKDRDMFQRIGKGKDKSLQFVGEAQVSRGLSQLLTPRRRVVYVLTGHGEQSRDDRGPNGLSDLVASLDIERFDTESLSLLQTGREGEIPVVPDDASVVFVAGPKADLTPDEEDILLDYVGRGGSLLYTLELGEAVPHMLSRIGLSVPEGAVADKEVFHPHNDRPVPMYRPHPITTELAEANLQTMLVHPAPIRIDDQARQGVRAEPVLTTSRAGWIEIGGELQNGAYAMDPGIDVEGVANMAVALELAPGGGLVRASKLPARVLVMGDAEAFSNAVIHEGPGNEALATNAINWLAGEDERLRAGGARPPTQPLLALTPEEMGTLRWLSLAVMPLLVGLAGLGTWSARRGR